MEENKSSFDLTTICPAYIFGVSFGSFVIAQPLFVH